MSQQINLLAPTIGKTPQFSLFSARAMSLGVGLAVVFALLYANYQDSRLSRIESEAKSVALALKAAAADAEKAGGVAKVARPPNPRLEAKVTELAAQLKGRQDVLEALKGGIVGTTGGFSEYMRVFSRQSTDGLWLTGFDIAAGGNDLTLTGRALSADLVPVYLQRLNREASMQGRQFASMAITQAPSAPEAARDAAAAKAARAPAGRREPPYVEFTLSSIEPATRQAAPGGQR